MDVAEARFEVECEHGESKETGGRYDEVVGGEEDDRFEEVKERCACQARKTAEHGVLVWQRGLASCMIISSRLVFGSDEGFNSMLTFGHDRP